MKTDWIDKKRKFLYSFFLSNKLNFGDLNLEIHQDKNVENENNKYTISSSWLSLLEASKKINCVIAPASNDLYFCGYKCDNLSAQKILEVAFNKKFQELIDYNDIDNEDILRENIIEYILINRLHHKSFANLIKNLRSIELDMLPNIL